MFDTSFCLIMTSFLAFGSPLIYPCMSSLLKSPCREASLLLLKLLKIFTSPRVISTLSLLRPLASASVPMCFPNYAFAHGHVCLVFIEINRKRALFINTRVWAFKSLACSVYTMSEVVFFSSRRVNAYRWLFHCKTNNLYFILCIICVPLLCLV